VVALALATMLIGTQVLPAFAVPPSGTHPVAPTKTPKAQVVSTASSDAVSVTRDGYSVIEPPKPKRSAGFASTANTFTNNPASPIQWPFDVGVPISSGFGSRATPCAGCTSEHEGLDMTPGAGVPIHAIADGVVREVGNPSGTLGVYAMIDHQIEGRTVSSIYGHMALGSLALNVGDQVKVRQLVGLVGSTGASTGPHLHLGILVDGTPVDPYAWLTLRVK
jgi:murein DD-endopeptidase MepM/ murein hydrolase activator NlpD